MTIARIKEALKWAFTGEKSAQIRRLTDRNDDQAETIRSQKTRTKEATDRAEAAERSEKDAYIRLSKLTDQLLEGVGKAPRR